MPLNIAPIGYIFSFIYYIIPLRVYFNINCLYLYPIGGIIVNMNTISKFVKEERKKAGLTQEEFAMRSGLGLRFVRELEQGKATVRLDKVNQALAMFGMETVPGVKEKIF